MAADIYNVGDLVWAKFQTLPYWPCEVVHVDTKITVRFLGDNTEEDVPRSKVKSWPNEKDEKFIATGKKAATTRPEACGAFEAALREANARSKPNSRNRTPTQSKRRSSHSRESSDKKAKRAKRASSSSSSSTKKEKKKSKKSKRSPRKESDASEDEDDDLPDVLTTSGASYLSVGRVVWAKCNAHPWWPGKILKVCSSKRHHHYAQVHFFCSPNAEKGSKSKVLPWNGASHGKFVAAIEREPDARNAIEKANSIETQRMNSVLQPGQEHANVYDSKAFCDSLEGRIAPAPDTDETDDREEAKHVVTEESHVNVTMKRKLELHVTPTQEIEPDEEMEMLREMQEKVRLLDWNASISVLDKILRGKIQSELFKLLKQNQQKQLQELYSLGPLTGMNAEVTRLTSLIQKQLKLSPEKRRNRDLIFQVLLPEAAIWAIQQIEDCSRSEAIEELNAKTWAITFEKTTSDLLDVSADSTEEVLPS